MKTNLSSQITLHRVSPRYYRPENAFEKSVLTRLEKIPTDNISTIIVRDFAGKRKRRPRRERTEGILDSADGAVVEYNIRWV